MAGKPTIDPKVHAKIRRLASQGHGRKDIAATLGVSLYTVRKALDPDFVERERERQRAIGPERYARRKDDPAYQAYQADYASAPERLAQVRASMALLRKNRRTPTED
ncbi:hypothetical protein [Azorhizobium doebereinerae]|uniref:hypothetical protein n=1 Tax=Azorhizobium doebereinerae TaxID=281091 RepID=UPI00048F5E2F|nr:hypothetical protein [Azorhizobium doebereinerae]